jgi:hypothetical protein
MTTAATPDDDPDDILPASEVNEAILADRAERKRGTIESICNPSTISREVISSIAKHVSPDKVGRVIARMLDAKRRLKDNTELDDTRTMEAGLKLYLAYMVGMPTQRQEIVSVNVDADNALGLEERLRHSPALRSMFRKMLDNVEGSTPDSTGPVVEG